jgi:hypothetical protein
MRYEFTTKEIVEILAMHVARERGWTNAVVTGVNIRVDHAKSDDDKVTISIGVEGEKA